MKPRLNTRAQRQAAVLLVLWFVIIVGFFAVPLMAYDCQHTGDCTSEFLHEVEGLENFILMIQFGFFFFIMAVCDICLPEGINRVILEQAFSVDSTSIKVLSPPPRFSHC